MPSMGAWASIFGDIVIGPLRTDPSASLGKCPRSTYFHTSLIKNGYPALINLDIIPHCLNVNSILVFDSSLPWVSIELDEWIINDISS